MFDVCLPRTIKIGPGTILGLPSLLKDFGLKAPAILVDTYLIRIGVLDRLLEILDDAGLRARVYSDILPDPTVTSVCAAAAFVQRGDHDCIVGVGGGSTIDTAKAVAVLVSQGGDIRRLKAPHIENSVGLPIIAVPTTAGTGSEATRFTVITDDTNDEKMLCGGLAYMPTIAILDYELTLTMPSQLTVETGIDALTHAIEAYVSRKANPLSDAMATAAIKSIWPNLPRVFESPQDREAREAMMLGSFQAGIAFSNSSVALVHGMSRPISAHFHVTHGLSNAMLLPAVTAWSASSAIDRYAVCAKIMGLADERENPQASVEKLIDALHELNRALSVPSPKDYGIAQGDWNRLLPLMSQQALSSGSPNNNPRIPDAAAIQFLYKQAWS